MSFIWCFYSTQVIILLRTSEFGLFDFYSFKLSFHKKFNHLIYSLCLWLSLIIENHKRIMQVFEESSTEVFNFIFIKRFMIFADMLVLCVCVFYFGTIFSKLSSD